MPASEIQSIAASRGYDLTGTNLVDEFLAEQELKYDFTQEELNSLTISEINDIANARGYVITQTLKADIIQEFLNQQA